MILHEKQNLYEWACRHADEKGESCFTAIDRDRDSYYEKAGTGYLHEYGFENAAELKALFRKQWEGPPRIGGNGADRACGGIQEHDADGKG